VTCGQLSLYVSPIPSNAEQIASSELPDAFTFLLLDSSIAIALGIAITTTNTTARSNCNHSSMHTECVNSSSWVIESTDLRNAYESDHLPSVRIGGVHRLLFPPVSGFPLT
jgi:hypothetical protein